MRVDRLVKHIPTILVIGFFITLVNNVDPTGNTGFIGKLEIIYQSLSTGNIEEIERAFFFASFQYCIILFLGVYAFVKIGKLMFTD